MPQWISDMFKTWIQVAALGGTMLAIFCVLCILWDWMCPAHKRKDADPLFQEHIRKYKDDFINPTQKKK